jgi:hypothetical protein
VKTKANRAAKLNVASVAPVGEVDDRAVIQ